MVNIIKNINTMIIISLKKIYKNMNKRDKMSKKLLNKPKKYH